MNIEQIVRLTQKELFGFLKSRFENCITEEGSFILVQGEAPVLLLAHLDTVHREPVKDICKTDDGNILMSPQGIGGDDRCGVYALLKAYDECEVKPSLLFLCDEEIGLVGAYHFADYYLEHEEIDFENVKYLIEIDRKGKDDCVFYELDYPEFEEFIEGYGFKSKWGSCSDISAVAPAVNRAAVNLSSGYYNAHTLHEYINMKELENVILKVKTMIDDSLNPEIPVYEYKAWKRKTTPAKTDTSKYVYQYKYENEDDDFYDDYYDYEFDKSYYDDYDDTYYSEKEYFESIAKCLEQHGLTLDDVHATYYYNEYLDLLDYYDSKILNDYIDEYGEQIILELWKSDFSYVPVENRKDDFEVYDPTEE